MPRSTLTPPGISVRGWSERKRKTLKKTRRGVHGLEPLGDLLGKARRIGGGVERLDGEDRRRGVVSVSSSPVVGKRVTMTSGRKVRMTRTTSASTFSRSQIVSVSSGLFE